LFSIAAAQENPQALLAALETFEAYLNDEQSKPKFLQFIGDPVEQFSEDAVDGNVS
jgi:hypothetical protein